MANQQLPIIPMSRPYYTVAEAMLTDSDGTVFKAVITSKDKKAYAHVFKLSSDRKVWNEIKGDWNTPNKPHTIGLAQSGGDLLVSLSTRENNDENDYPSRTYIAAGACVGK